MRRIGEFFAVTFNAWGGNYVYIDPMNEEVVTTVDNYVDFANLGWFFETDPSRFTYNAQSNTMWALISVGQGEAIGGIVLDTNNAITGKSYQVLDYHELQVIY